MVASNLVNVGKASIKKNSDICHDYTRGVLCANFSQFKKRMVTNVIFFDVFPCVDDYEQKSKNSGKNLTNQKLENILIEWPILNCPKKDEVEPFC